jgi:cell division transport system permease protein
MTPLVHWLAQTLRSIRSHLLIQLAATGAVAVGLLLVGLAVLGAHNVERLTRHWGSGIQVIAYMKPEVSRASVEAMARVLRARPEVLSVREVSSAAAYQRLEESLGGRKQLLAGVERDVLPASLEISLNRGDEALARPILALLSASPPVEEVDHLGAWVSRLDSLAALLRLGALGLALLVGCACLYIVATTIRLGVFARREEIEILKLVGATDRYVRAPYLIEGAVQGLSGSLVGVGALFVLFRVTAPRVEGLMASVMSHLQLAFLSPMQLALGISAGTLLGFLGSRLALRRYLDV